MSAAPDVARKEGFTLLELLVALALTAIIGATMAMTVTLLRPIRAFEERMEKQQIASAIADVLARDLGRALRTPLLEAGGTTGLLMKGEEERVTFTSVVPTGYMRYGLREVTYERLRTDRGSRLVRTTRLRRFARQQDDGWTQIDELYSGALTLKFSYFRSDSANSPVWTSDFAEINQLPLAVRIEVGTGHPNSPATRRTIRYATN